MNSRDFCYWLQGYFEVSSAEGDGICMTDRQVIMIQNHLNLVFKHEIDPSMGGKEHQEELNKIHFSSPMTEAEAIVAFGPKPSVNHEFNIHGWYNPNESIPRC